MPVIVGIDASWTLTQPSGVSLVAGQPGNWRLLAIATSYANFYRQVGLDGSALDVRLLLDSASHLAGVEKVDLIAADIPLALTPIIGRREADNAVSRLYGARHAGTHTPSALRPGMLADKMRVDFLAEGYRLQTSSPATSGLIEVYPHPALIELVSAPRRLPYKIGKAAKYWPEHSALERRANVIAQWGAIVDRLERHIIGIAELLPLPTAHMPLRILKGYEDALDAVVCGWVGTRVIEGLAVALGDDDAAIWVPTA